jgi:hypothetical protein
MTMTAAWPERRDHPTMRDSISGQRLCLQFVMILACLIPIGAGLAGSLLGSRMIDKVGMGMSEAGISQDSQFRYLSGLLLAVGLCFLSLVPKIERAGAAMRLLTFIVFIGGLARLVGVISFGLPSRPMLGGLTMELAVTPLLCLWQMNLARRFRAEGMPAG